MPQATTLNAFIAMVVSGQHAEAIEQFYLEGASMQENNAAPRVGRSVLVAHERAALARFTGVHTECVQPVLHKQNTVVIRWVFTFTLPSGGTMRIEELAWQRWEGEKIAEEKFFYDPAQMRTPVGSTPTQQAA